MRSDRSVDELELSKEAARALSREDIVLLKDLARLTETDLRAKGLSKKLVREIQRALIDQGLSLRSIDASLAPRVLRRMSVTAKKHELVLNECEQLVAEMRKTMASDLPLPERLKKFKELSDKLSATQAQIPYAR